MDSQTSSAASVKVNGVSITNANAATTTAKTS